MASDDELASTQSQATICTQSSIYIERQPEIWGRLYEKKITRKNLGIRKQSKFFVEHTRNSYDLINDSFTAGRASINDYCFTSDDISYSQYKLISKIHFKLTKDTSDLTSPTYIENHSRNGIFVNMEKVEHKRILSHDDVISTSYRTYRAFVYKDLQRMYDNFPENVTKKFHIGKKLGAGVSGAVFLVHNLRTCKPYALKQIRKNQNTERNPNKLLNEAKILKKLDHPCIIQIHDTINTSEALFLTLELMEGGTLLHRIKSTKFLLENISKLYFYQICHAIGYLHDNKIIHRDLKPENILLASNDIETLVKVSDFGLSKSLQNGSVLKTWCGTPLYIAPEIFTADGREYTKKVDIWSLGVILYICLSGCFPFTSDWDCENTELDPGSLIMKPFEFNAAVWQTISEQAKSFINRMLTIDVNRRPGIYDLIKDRWLNDEPTIQLAHKIMNLPASSSS